MDYPLPDTKPSKNGTERKAKKPKPHIINRQGVPEAIDDPHRLARLYLDAFPSSTRWREDWYSWTDPAYRLQTDDDIKAELVEILKEEFDFLAGNPEIEQFEAVKITKTLLNNVLECLKALCHHPSRLNDPFWKDATRTPTEGLIVADNGILQLTDDGTISHRPPSPSLFTTNALDYPYDPEADCPNWMEFLDSVWGVKSDCVTTLQEMMGYALTDDTTAQKIFMFIGARRSGKGTIARVMRGLVGEQNVCNPILGALQGTFGLEPLYGKRLAIVGDARLSGRADAHVIVERLLSISGEDALVIDRKYKAPITTQLKTRFLLISNELPNLADASATLPSRVILLPFTKSFYGNEDPKLTEKLLAERPGILNWALCGLKRYRDRGRFIQPEASREIIGEMEELSSPVLAFVRDRLDVSPGFACPVADVFQEWKSWCESKGRKPSSQQTFGRDLRAAVPSLRMSQPRIDGRQTRTYETVRIRTNDDFETH